MILGFEEQTYDLTEIEIVLAGLIAKGLITKVGKKMAVTNKFMQAKMLQHGHKIDAARMRAIIHYIRMNNIVPNLLSTSKGYFVSTSVEDTRKYIHSLRQRANSIKDLANAMENVLVIEKNNAV